MKPELEKLAEEAREKALAKREERKTRGSKPQQPESKPEPAIEPVITGPKMDIYTEEELAELEKRRTSRSL